MSDIIDYPITSNVHPVNSVENPNLDNIVCITFPHSVFFPNATSFGQFQDSGAGKSYRTILQIFAAISESPSLGYDVQLTDETEIEKYNRAFHDTEDGHPVARIRRYMERIPSINNPRVTIAWRLYLFVSDSKFGFGMAFNNLIKRNNKECKKHMESSAKFRTNSVYNPKMDSHKTILTTAAYMNNIVCAYTGKAMSDTDVISSFGWIESSQNIPETSSIAAPLDVFSLDRSFNHPLKEMADARLFDVESYMDPDSSDFIFPEPSNVWEVTHYAFTPRIILRMRWFNITQQFNSSPTRNEQMEMNAKLLNFRDSDMDVDENEENDIKRMSIRNKDELKKLQQQGLGDDEMSSEMSKFLENSREEFESVMSKDAHLSPTMISMMKWFETGTSQQKHDGVPFSPFINVKRMDPTLSPFANMIIRLMVQFEVISKVANAHLPALMCTMAIMDSTRHEYAMKLNVILGGPSVASKSYIINMVTALAVPDTVQPLTHQTKRALNTDTPVVDQVHAYDEMSLKSLGYDPQDSSTGDNTIKASTTNGQITNQVFHHDEQTGKRTHRTNTIDCIITRIGATNEQLRMLPEALASRFHFILVEGVDHPDRSIIDLINSNDDKLIRTKKFAFKNEYRFYHYVCALVFKAIQIHAMADVDMEISAILFTRMLKKLNSKGYRMSNPRVMQRMKIVARVLTVMNAIYVCFMSDTALYPPDTVFNIKMIYKLCPYLVCTEEIAIFAFTMFTKDIVNSSEREMIMAAMILINRQVESDDLGSDNQRWASRGSEETSTSDYNYYFLKFSGGKGPSFSGLARMVKSVITNKRVSVENIEFILHGCKDRSLQVKSFLSTDAFGQSMDNGYTGESSREGSNMMNADDIEHTPEGMAEYIATRCDVRDGASGGTISSKPIMEFVKNPPGIKFLRHYVEQCAMDMHHEKSSNYKTPILEAIDCVQHKYTRNRSVLTALQCPGFQETAPHVLRVVHMRKNDSVMQVTNNNSVTTFEQRVLDVDASEIKAADVIEIDGDLENYRVYSRALEPDVDMDDEIYNSACPVNYENRIAGTNIYPQKYLEEIRSKQKRTRSVKRGKAISNIDDITGMGSMVKWRRLESSENISRRVEMNERANV